MKNSLQKINIVLPKAVSILVVLAGLVNVVSAISARSFARLDILMDFVPLEVAHVTRTLTLLIGIFLLSLGRGLWNRKRRSWWLSVVLISISIPFHLIKGLDFEEAIFLLSIYVVLFMNRAGFSVQSGRMSWRGAVRGASLALIFVAAYSFFGFFILQAQFNKPVTVTRIMEEYTYNVFGIGQEQLIPHTRLSKWFERTQAVTGVSAVIIVLAVLFAPVVTRNLPTDEERKKARRLILQYNSNPFGYLGLMDDKQLYFSKDHEGVIAYKIAGGVAVVVGDPVGPPETSGKLTGEFFGAMKHLGLSVACINVGESRRTYYEGTGLTLIKIGEEAIIKPPEFTLDGPDMAEVRHCVNRMKRENVRFEWYTMDAVPWRAMHDIDQLHRRWLASKSGPAITFSVDYYPFPPERRAFVLAVYSSTGSLWAAYSFFPYLAGRGMSLEMMLRDPQALNSTVEAAIAESARFFRERGIQEISLGVATLIDVQGAATAGGPIDRSKQILLAGLNQIYQYRSLFDFKKKFNPRWEPKYLAYGGTLEFPKVVNAVVRAHLKHGGIVQTLLKWGKK